MAKIMLLDDSPVMHRVVKLTFADDPQIDISVARTPDEVEQVIVGAPVDLIIAYARFSGDADVGYFEALSFVAPRLLLLAEDDEDMDPFVNAGFSSILRKPFHSDELRQVVDALLSSESDGRARRSAEPRRLAPTPPPAPPARSGAPTPPPAPPARSGAPTPPPASPARSGAPTPPPAPPARSGAPTPPPAPPARSGAPTPPPASPARSGAPTPPPRTSKAPEMNDTDAPFSGFEFEPVAAEDRQRNRNEFGNNDGSDDEDTKELNHLSLSAKKSASKAPEKSSFGVKSEPQITLDLSGLKQQAFGNAFNATRQMSSFLDADDLEDTRSVPRMDVASERPTLKSALAASTPGATRRSIEPVAFDDAPMSIENVMVSPRHDGHGADERHSFQLSQDDVERLVEEKVAIAVSRAVRQALNETIPELRQGVVNEVSQRAVEQLSGELREIRQSLRDAVSGELKELSSQWLRRETPSLAKDVIREEIRRVIENI